MAVTDPTAIRFSNQRLRVGADLLARAYSRCQSVSDRWTALGGGQSAIDIMEGEMRQAADQVYAAYSHVYHSEKLWFLLGGTALIPDDSAEDISDGSPADSRPAVNGQDAVRLVTRMQELQNWMLSAGGSFTDSTRANVAYLNTILAVSSEADPVMSVADAGNFINRCNELVADYEATTNTNLTHVLAYSVNPQV